MWAGRIGVKIFFFFVQSFYFIQYLHKKDSNFKIILTEWSRSYFVFALESFDFIQDNEESDTVMKNPFLNFMF